MPPFKWEDIDHSLVRLKLTTLAEEMHQQIAADERRMQFENLRNLNSFAVPSLVLNMKEQRAEEFAERVYELYCSVWQTQGRLKSAAFLRAVYGGGILPALRARAGTIASEFARVAGRANCSGQVRNANLAGLRARKLRLETRWARRIEAEAKECEHIERRQKSGVQSQAIDFSSTNVVLKTSRNGLEENSPASAQPVATKPAGSGLSVSPLPENPVSDDSPREAVSGKARNPQLHTVVSRAKAAVSGTLLQEVTSLFKRLFKIHYESRGELQGAPEWQELIKLFCDACDTYVSLAMGNRRKIRGDLLAWVTAQIEEDQDAISIQHFACDRNGYFVEKASKSRLGDHQEDWSAQYHVPWMPVNIVTVWSVYQGETGSCCVGGTWECSDPNRIRKHKSTSDGEAGYVRQ